MSELTITEVLRELELLESLEPDELERLVGVGRVEYWRDGAMVLEQGEDGPRMMVLLEGRVDVLRRDPNGVQREVATLGPGEILGETSLLLDLPRSASVRATEAIRCFTIDRRAFQELVAANDPAVLKLGLALSRVLAERLVRLNERVVALLSEAESASVADKYGEARQELFRLWDY